MVYITLDELKEILPDILNNWIDDEGDLEWIFQEIEQKCHVGKRKKDKKRKKKLRDDVDELTRKVDVIVPQLIGDTNSNINRLTKRVDELSNKISNLSASHTATASRVSRVERDIIATKSMAKTARDRTQVDYTKCSKEKSDNNTVHDTLQEVYDRMVGRGATKEELDSFIDLINKYDALEKKEIPVINKTCEMCKYFDGDPKYDVPQFDKLPCNECNFNDKWEAKDNE